MLTQYLILIIIGAFIGIGLVLSIIKSVMSGMIGGGMMGGGMMGGGGYYPPQYYGGGAAALGFTLVFVFLLGFIIMASRQIQNGQNILPNRTEQQEQTYQYGQENSAPKDNTYSEKWLEDAVPDVIRVNQSPSHNRHPAREVDLRPDSYGSAAPIQQIQESEAPVVLEWSENSYQKEEGTYYIQVSAGSDETAALDQVRRMKQQLPDQAWIGVSADNNPFKCLIGPFSTRQSAQDVQSRLDLQGFVREVIQDGIEVYNVR